MLPIRNQESLEFTGTYMPKIKPKRLHTLKLTGFMTLICCMQMAYQLMRHRAKKNWCNGNVRTFPSIFTFCNVGTTMEHTRGYRP